MSERASTTQRLVVKKADFLRVLGERGTISEAAKAVGVDRSTAYLWRDRDEAFAAEWAASFDATTDLLEQTAVEYALNGYTETRTIDDGETVKTETHKKKDPNTLRFLLGARRRSTYGAKTELEISGDLVVKRIAWQAEGEPPPLEDLDDA